MSDPHPELHGMVGVPTRPSRRKAWLLAGALLVLGVGMAILGRVTYSWFTQLFYEGKGDLTSHADLIRLTWVYFAIPVLSYFLLVAGGMCALAGLLGFGLRIPQTLEVMRGAILGLALAALFYFLLPFAGFGLALAFEEAFLKPDERTIDKIEVVYASFRYGWPGLLGLLFFAYFYVAAHAQAVIGWFAGVPKTASEAPAWGDYTLENLRTHGADKRFRISSWLSFLAHFSVLILPVLLSDFGCIEPYRVPKGSGNPVVALVKMVKPKKKKKKKKITVNPNSAFIFEMPDLDDSESEEEMNEISEVQVKTGAVNAKAGKMGEGGGKDGGWPNGVPGGEVRFIRLKYGSKGWDDGLTLAKGGSDFYFLREVKKQTPFPTRTNGEAHPIHNLADYPDDAFPPFVYMTGNGSIRGVSSSDRKTLRTYCYKGGMLIADAADPAWDRSFRRFILSVFPGKRLLTIADDDVIFQQPYQFPNGAPPLWAHGGTRAMGIKHEGRWIVFYHPGDLNDAWKPIEFSGVSPELRQQAFQLGLNLIHYSFSQWNAAVGAKR